MFCQGFISSAAIQYATSNIIAKEIVKTRGFHNISRYFLSDLIIFPRGREKSTRCNIGKSEVKFLIMSKSWLEISNLKTSSASTVAFVWRLNITDAGIHRENLYCTGLQFFFTFAAPALSISVLVPASHRNRRNHVNLR